MGKTSHIPSPGRRTTTHTLDGIEIIARDDAYGAHPNPKIHAKLKNKLVKYRDISEILLIDETKRFECDFCGHTSTHDDAIIAVRQISSHINGMHRANRAGISLYSDETLKHIIREVEYQKRLLEAKRAAGQPIGHDIYSPVVDRLNAAGVKTVHGGPWNNASLSSVYRTYCKKIRVTLSPSRLATIRRMFLSPIPGDPSITAVAADATIHELVDETTAAKLKNIGTSESTTPKSTPTPSRNPAGRKLVVAATSEKTEELISSGYVFDRLARVRSAIRDVLEGNFMNLQGNISIANTEIAHLTDALNTYVSDVNTALNHKDEEMTPDPVLVEKASRYDAMREMLGYNTNDNS